MEKAFKFTEEDLDILQQVAANGQVGRITPTEIKELVRVYRLATNHPAMTKWKNFQEGVHQWIRTCFSNKVTYSHLERNHRLYEEATELVQATGYSREQCHATVDEVFDRDQPPGETTQEVGGMIVCLAALCSAHAIDMEGAAAKELGRIWMNIGKIREKQAQKKLAVKDF